MLLGIYGPHCVGKTTYLQGLVEQYPHIRPVYGDVLVINYDNIHEFTAESKWYRMVPGKTAVVQHAIRSKRELWVVEGCRFWGGIISVAVDEAKRMNGGWFLIGVTTTPQYMRHALEQRSKINNREFDSVYWTPRLCEYEASRRLMNAVSKYVSTDDYIILKHDGQTFDSWTKSADDIVAEFQDQSIWYNVYRTPVVWEGIR